MARRRIALAAIGLLATFGCSRPTPPPKVDPAPVAKAPALLLEIERPRDEFSQRVIPQDDAPASTAEEPEVFVPISRESDG